MNLGIIDAWVLEVQAQKLESRHKVLQQWGAKCIFHEKETSRSGSGVVIKIWNLSSPLKI